MPTLTTTEAATKLSITRRSVARLIKRGLIVAERATPDELAGLLTAGRIRSVPPTGAMLIEADEVERHARERRPAHRPRKQQAGRSLLYSASVASGAEPEA